MARLVDKTVVGLVICSLAGCASYRGVPTSAVPKQTSYKDITEKISAQQKLYGDAARDWSGSDFWYDTGLIVLAMGSVAAVAFSHGTAQANILAGVGIGAGGVSLFRSAQNGSGKQLAYMKANVQLACLLDKATTYDHWPDSATIGALDPDSTELKIKNDELAEAIAALDKRLPEVQKLRQTVTTSTVRAEGNNSVTVNITADAGLIASALGNNLEQARAIHIAAQTELDEAKRGLPLLLSTFTAIDSQAYTAAKGTQVNWNQATTFITQAIPTPPAAPASPSGFLPMTFSGDSSTRLALSAADDVSTRASAVLKTRVMEKKLYSTTNAAIKLCAAG